MGSIDWNAELQKDATQNPTPSPYSHAPRTQLPSTPPMTKDLLPSIDWNAVLAADQQVQQTKQTTPNSSLVADKMITRHREHDSFEIADTSTGIPLDTLALSSFATNPQTKLNYLKQLYGDAAYDSKTDDYYVYQEGSKVPVRITNKDWSSWLANQTGNIVEALPTLASGASPWLAPATAVAGTALRQAVAAALPGTDETPIVERAMDIGTSGGLGALPGGAAWGAKKATNLLGKRTVKGAEQKVLNEIGQDMLDPSTLQKVQEGVNLESNTPGLQLSLGELTQSPRIQNLEKTLRKNEEVSLNFDKLVENNKRVLETEVDTFLNRISDKSVDKTQAGNQLASYMTEAWDAFDKKAHEELTKSFDKAFRPATTGKIRFKPRIRLSNTENMLFNRAMEIADLPLIPEGVINEGRTYERQLFRIWDDSRNGTVTPEQFQKILSKFGEAAYGGTDTISGVTNKTHNRTTAKRIMEEGLYRDLDQAI
jgi:hypothetical protein